MWKRRGKNKRRRGEKSKNRKANKKSTTINEHVEMADAQRKTFYRYESVRCLFYMNKYPCTAQVSAQKEPSEKETKEKYAQTYFIKLEIGLISF